MLGAFFAICSAATFGFNSATMRRGVLSGTVFQAIAKGLNKLRISK